MYWHPVQIAIRALVPLAFLLTPVLPHMGHSHSPLTCTLTGVLFGHGCMTLYCCILGGHAKRVLAICWMQIYQGWNIFSIMMPFVWPSNVKQHHGSWLTMDWGGYGLLPDSTKPLPEPVLTHHQIDVQAAWVFIRPFEKRTYYAMAMSIRLSVRPSVRPSEFSGLFFNVLWDINLKLGICIQ